MSKSAGFTLLEIVLVIVVMAVITALVVPSMFSASVRSAADETRRLQQTLRLAADEAQLAGTPMRWWARRGSYGFQQLISQQWQPAAGHAFALHKLDGVVIDRVVENGVDQQPEDDAMASSQQAEGDFFDRKKRDNEPLVGRVVMLPNGTVTMVDIILMTKNLHDSRRLLVRPGPSGIREEEGKGKP